MAGHHISLLHITRLKCALQANVTSSKFKELKVFKEIAYYLFRDDIFKYLFVLCRDMYATMRVFCLAGYKTPAMEKLLYFFLQTDHMLPKWLKDAEDHSNNLLSIGVKKIF